ncbi:Fur family transcriptional regulator [Fimbriiglobus ruber]|uniref:Ferric uptake regulation protein n=1 Tax=Fimbriiglobus ruber TaxID=1908690 RepID=A0A225E667_9BACT|nr:Fur family transcriptional regulator [Fimbriiglobus ruber]OWK44989.1 Ferric uptake regulation protein FUR [Fimbriiglobus ruber]
MSLPAVAVSQTPEERFREFLASRPKPQRFTDQQGELVRHIFAKHKHFDTDELLDDLKQTGKRVSRATVYRTLSKLVDAGLLRRIEIGTRTVYDHDYGYPQHEHLVCESCKKMIEFQHPAIDAALREIANAHQFRADGHSLVVRGTCAECNADRAARRRLVM